MVLDLCMKEMREKEIKPNSQNQQPLPNNQATT